MWRRVCRVLPALAVCLAACSPTTLFDCRLPRRDGSVVVEDDHPGQYVLAFGKRHGPFEAVALDTLRPSPDGRRLAWAARESTGWRVYVDGAPGATWDGVSELAWSDGSEGVVYAAERAGSWHVVDPAGISRGFRSLTADSLQPCQDSSAYVATDGSGTHVVVGDQEFGPFLGAGGLEVDASCSAHAFATRSSDGAYVHATTARYGPYLDVAEVVLAPRTGRVAASVLTSEGWRALTNDVLSEPMASIGRLRFSADGRRLAFAARGMAPDDPWFVYDADEKVGPFQDVQHHALALSSDGRRLAFAAALDGRQRVIVDGEPLPPRFDEVRHLAFADEAPTLGFVGISTRGAEVFIGQELRGHYQTVADFALSPQGDRFLAAATMEDSPMLIVDDVPHRFTPIAGTLTFDSSGGSWGALANGPSRYSLFFVLDGERGPTLELLELADLLKSRGVTSVDRVGQALRDWVRAELDRH